MLHSKYVNGHLVFYDDHPHRWVDAIGPYARVFKIIPGMVAAGFFTETAVSAGTGTSAMIDGVASPGLDIVTAANDFDGVNEQVPGELFQCIANKPFYTGIKCTLGEATTKDFLWGLCITDTTLLATSSSHASTLTDGVYFESLDTVTALTCVTEKNSTETTSSSVGTIVAGTAMILEIVWDGTTMYFYKDGVLGATSTTNIPDDEELTPSLNFRAGSAAAESMTIDWWTAIQIQS